MKHLPITPFYKNGLEIPICTPCIDSFTLSIKRDKVEFLEKRMLSEILTYYVDIDEMDDEIGRPKPYIYDQNGIRIRFWLKSIINPEDGSSIESVGITVTSKLLKDRYFQGFTRANVELAYEFLMSMKAVKFSFQDFLNAQISDVDICYNFRTKPLLFLDLAKYYERILKQGNARFFRLHRQITRDGDIKNLGLSLNTREQATAARPYVKFYYKTLELEGKSKDFYEKYLLPHSPNISDLFRLEYTIKGYFQKRRLLKQKTLKRNYKSLSDLLHFSKEELKAVCLSFHQDYFNISQKEDRSYIRDLKDLSPSDMLICNLLQQLIEKDTPTQELYSVLDLFGSDVQSRNRKSRLKTKIKKMIDHVENNSLSLKKQRQRNTDLQSLIDSLQF